MGAVRGEGSVRLPSLHCLHGMWFDNTLSLMMDDEK